MTSDAALVVGIVAALLLLGGLFSVVAVRGKRWADSAAEPDVAPEPFAPDPRERPRAAVVVNPTKFDGGTGAVRRQVEDACASAGW
ncbi:MAG: hypothetical protein ACOYXW_09995, partial [Actinomycetota bacterium]